MGAVAPDLAAPRAIRPDDDASQFSCGDEVKDQWVRKYAVANHFGGGAKVYVAVRGTRIVGFYALATASIQHSDATPRVSKSMPDPVSAILLGRLAVDSKEAGKSSATSSRASWRSFGRMRCAADCGGSGCCPQQWRGVRNAQAVLRGTLQG